MSSSKITIDTEFCLDCGSILCLPEDKSNVMHCYCCGRKWELSSDNVSIAWKHEIVYQKTHNFDGTKRQKHPVPAAKGPLIDRTCSKCGCETMSYSSCQTRSADEGMTVFYTCIKCGYKDIDYT